MLSFRNYLGWTEPHALAVQHVDIVELQHVGMTGETRPYVRTSRTPHANFVFSSGTWRRGRGYVPLIEVELPIAVAVSS